MTQPAFFLSDIRTRSPYGLRSMYTGGMTSELLFKLASALDGQTLPVQPLPHGRGVSLPLVQAIARMKASVVNNATPWQMGRQAPKQAAAAPLVPGTSGKTPIAPSTPKAAPVLPEGTPQWRVNAGNDIQELKTAGRYTPKLGMGIIARHQNAALTGGDENTARQQYQHNLQAKGEANAGTAQQALDSFNKGIVDSALLPAGHALGLVSGQDANAYHEMTSLGNPTADTALNTVARIGGGVAGTAPLMAVKAPLAATALFAGQGGVSGDLSAAEEIARARQNGQNISTGQALAMRAGNAGLGGVMGAAFPTVAGTGGRVVGQLGGDITRRVAGRTLGRVLGSGLASADLSGLHTAASNVIARNTIDPNRSIGQGVGNSALTGGAMGAAFGGMNAYGKHDPRTSLSVSNEVLPPTSPYNVLSPWYAKVPGGLDKVYADAKTYWESDPQVAQKAQAGFQSGLYRVVRPEVPGSRAAPTARFAYAPEARNAFGGPFTLDSSGPTAFVPRPGTAPLGSMASAVTAHEIGGHGSQKSEDIAGLMGRPYTAADLGLEKLPSDGMGHINRPIELLNNVGEIKRQYALHTGKPVTNPQEASEALAWYRQNTDPEQARRVNTATHNFNPRGEWGTLERARDWLAKRIPSDLYKNVPGLSDLLPPRFGQQNEVMGREMLKNTGKIPTALDYQVYEDNGGFPDDWAAQVMPGVVSNQPVNQLPGYARTFGPKQAGEPGPRLPVEKLDLPDITPMGKLRGVGAEAVTTPRQALAPAYSKLPGGINREIDLAKGYAASHKMTELEDQDLSKADRPLALHSVPTEQSNYSAGGETNVPASFVNGARESRSEPVSSYLSRPAPVSKYIAHHDIASDQASSADPATNRALQLMFGRHEVGHSLQRNDTRWTTLETNRKLELSNAAADIKRLYSDITGQPVHTPEDALKAISWFRQNMGKTAPDPKDPSKSFAIPEHPRFKDVEENEGGFPDAEMSRLMPGYVRTFNQGEPKQSADAGTSAAVYGGAGALAGGGLGALITLLQERPKLKDYLKNALIGAGLGGVGGAGLGAYRAGQAKPTEDPRAGISSVSMKDWDLQPEERAKEQIRVDSGQKLPEEDPAYPGRSQAAKNSDTYEEGVKPLTAMVNPAMAPAMVAMAPGMAQEAATGLSGVVTGKTFEDRQRAAEKLTLNGMGVWMGANTVRHVLSGAKASTKALKTGLAVGGAGALVEGGLDGGRMLTLAKDIRVREMSAGREDPGMAQALSEANGIMQRQHNTTIGAFRDYGVGPEGEKLGPIDATTDAIGRSLNVHPVLGLGQFVRGILPGPDSEVMSGRIGVAQGEKKLGDKFYGAQNDAAGKPSGIFRLPRPGGGFQYAEDSAGSKPVKYEDPRVQSLVKGWNDLSHKTQGDVE